MRDLLRPRLPRLMLALVLGVLSLGSALALGIALHRRGTTARVSFAAPDQMPPTLRPLDVYGLVVPPEQVPADPEVLVVCDAAEPSRLGALVDRLPRAGTSIMIDHHVSNPGFGEVQLLDPAAEATVVIVRRLLAELGVPLDIDVARCIYAGLVTDTGNFVTAGAAAHRLAAELIETGVRPPKLVRSLMFTHPFAWLAAFGGLLERAVLESDAVGGLGLVHTTVPAADMRRFAQPDTDSVVDLVRTTSEAEVAAVFKETGPGSWVTQLRSDGRIDVAAVAARLGGGGHPGAAGFRFTGTVDDLLVALRGALNGGVPVSPAPTADARPDPADDRAVPTDLRPASRELRPATVDRGGRPARRAFVAAALRRPSTIGAVVPSSARLAEVLATVVPRVGAPVVVELGPGTGAVSEVISARLPSGARHLAVELDQGMVDYLRTHQPGLEVVQGDAATLAELLADHGVTHVDAVVSGLPWALFDGATQAAILGAVSEVIGSTGAFTTFAYVHGLTLGAARRFRATLRATFDEVVVSGIVWRNVPPAFVYVCRRPTRRR